MNRDIAEKFEKSERRRLRAIRDVMFPHCFPYQRKRVNGHKNEVK